MSEPEKQCILCITVQYGQWNPTSIAEGSVVTECTACGTDIYLSRSGQKLKAEAPHTELICTNCAEQHLKALKAKGEDVKFGHLPGL